MESILKEAEKEETWKKYLKYKLEQPFLSYKEKEELKEYIENKKYKDISKKILSSEYKFSTPKKHLVNKLNKQKKRVVYTFNYDEMMYLKLITFLMLRKYDYLFCDNCYSFRKDYGVKQAIFNITRTENIDSLCSYKIDIENYFNSISIKTLLPILKEALKGDELLYELFVSILENEYVEYNGEIIKENKGIMAGVPISSFLANLYLKDMDFYFYNNNILYARYSDDIILFAEEEKIGEYVNILEEKIKENALIINENKRKLTKTNEEWSFLGFSYNNGIIDISRTTKKKIKGKIRRAARKIRRWMIKKDATPDRALRALNRKFNRKFFGINQENSRELTWARWFFPIINTDIGLKEIDKYMQAYLRYIITGRHRKKNYNISYEYLKECNYISLVAEYYNMKKSKDNIESTEMCKS